MHRLQLSCPVLCQRPGSTIVRCTLPMKRVFSHPLLPLVIGLLLRLFFLFRLPSSAGDAPLYEALASNWLHQHVYGIPVDGVLRAVDIRMPGYPAYLALIQAITRRSAEDSRFWVMLGQVFLDLVSCLIIAEKYFASFPGCSLVCRALPLHCKLRRCSAYGNLRHFHYRAGASFSNPHGQSRTSHGRPGEVGPIWTARRLYEKCRSRWHLYRTWNALSPGDSAHSDVQFTRGLLGSFTPRPVRQRPARFAAFDRRRFVRALALDDSQRRQPAGVSATHSQIFHHARRTCSHRLHELGTHLALSLPRSVRGFLEAQQRHHSNR